MSGLEIQVQPFLRGMAVNGAITLLDDARKATLAAWCVKTAMVTVSLVNRRFGTSSSLTITRTITPITAT